MRRLNRERGLTFLIVTHDISVGRATDRIVRMVDGEIVGRRTPGGEALMVARVTLAEVDAVRMSIDAALELYRTSVVPALHEQGGYRGLLRADDARGQGAGADVLGGRGGRRGRARERPLRRAGRQVRDVFRAPPGRELYDVASPTLPTARGESVRS